MILTSRETGAGEPIVILHGLFGSARNWQSIAQKLSISNHIFTIDLPNHGSSGWTNCMSYGNLSRILSKFIVEKGSIAINGISLTIANVKETTFDVSIIPHTYNNTNLSNLKVGDNVNIEFDALARYINSNHD